MSKRLIALLTSVFIVLSITIVMFNTNNKDIEVDLKELNSFNSENTIVIKNNKKILKELNSDENVSKVYELSNFIMVECLDKSKVIEKYSNKAHVEEDASIVISSVEVEAGDKIYIDENGEMRVEKAEASEEESTDIYDLIVSEDTEIESDIDYSIEQETEDIRDCHINVDKTLYKKNDKINKLLKDNKKSAKDVIVAVIDTGYCEADTTEDASNGQLVSNRVLDTLNLSAYDNSYDTNGHGTFMSNIILKNTDDNVKILPIKVAGKDGTTTLSRICLAIEESVKRNVDVINISMNAKVTFESKLLEDLIDNASSKGIKVVVSAGNSGGDLNEYIPGNIESAIVVGSTNPDGELHDFTNSGDTLDFTVMSASTSEASAFTSSLIATLIEYGLEDKLEGLGEGNFRELAKSIYVDNKLSTIYSKYEDNFSTSTRSDGSNYYRGYMNQDIGNRTKIMLSMYGARMTGEDNPTYQKIMVYDEYKEHYLGTWGPTYLSNIWYNNDGNCHYMGTNDCTSTVKKFSGTPLIGITTGSVNTSTGARAFTFTAEARTKKVLKDVYFSDDNINYTFSATHEDSVTDRLVKYKIWIGSSSTYNASEANSVDWKYFNSYGTATNQTLNTSVPAKDEYADKYIFFEVVSVTGNSARKCARISFEKYTIKYYDIVGGTEITSLQDKNYKYVNKKLKSGSGLTRTTSGGEKQYWTDWKNSDGTIIEETGVRSTTLTVYGVWVGSYTIKINPDGDDYVKKWTASGSTYTSTVQQGQYISKTVAHGDSWIIGVNNTYGKANGGMSLYSKYSDVSTITQVGWQVTKGTGTVKMNSDHTVVTPKSDMSLRPLHNTAINITIDLNGGKAQSSSGSSLVANQGYLIASPYTYKYTSGEINAKTPCKVPLYFAYTDKLGRTYTDEKVPHYSLVGKLISKPYKPYNKFTGFELTVSPSGGAENKFSDGNYTQTYNGNSLKYVTKNLWVSDRKASVTLKAQWEPITYTVEIDPNGGSFVNGSGRTVSDTITKTYYSSDSYLPISRVNSTTAGYGTSAYGTAGEFGSMYGGYVPSTPVKEYYDFAGWDIYDADTGVLLQRYDSGVIVEWDVVNDTSKKVLAIQLSAFSGANIRAVARYKEKKYNFTVDPNGGTFKVTGIVNGSSVTNYSTSSKVTLTDYIGRTICASSTGSSASNVSSINHVVPSLPTRSGYTFLGWYIVEGNSYTAKLNTDNLSGITCYCTTFEYPNMKIKARWKSNTQMFALDPNGGTYIKPDGTSSSDMYYINNTYTKSTVDLSTSDNKSATSSLISMPYKKGYTFLGWYRVVDNVETGEVSTLGSNGYYSYSNTDKTQDITLRAKWKISNYQIAIDPNGGSYIRYYNTVDTAPYTMYAIYGNRFYVSNIDSSNCVSTYLNSAPTRQYYTFDAWYICDDMGNMQTKITAYEPYPHSTSYNAYYFDFAEEKSLTVKANWIPYTATHTIYYQLENADGTFASSQLALSNSYKIGDTVSWSRSADSTYEAASVSYTVDSSNYTGKTTTVKVYRKKLGIKVSGIVDGVAKEDLSGYATFDVYCGGSLRLNDVSKAFIDSISSGTSYEVKDIKTSSGYTYTGISSTSSALSGTFNGSKYVELVIKDSANPSVSISASPSGWTNSGTTITASASDGQSGVKADSLKIIRESDGTTVASGTTFASYTDTSAGTEKYYATCSDNAGNTGSSSSVTSYVDKTNPNISVSTSASTITVTVSDPVGVGNDVSGINASKTVLKNSSGTAVAALPSGQSSFSYTVTGEGSSEFTAEVYDNAGNSNSKSVTVVKDTTPPSGSISASPSTWTNGNVTITLSPDSGVTDVKTSEIRNGASTVVKTGSGSITYTDTTEGSETYYGKLVDYAGNAFDCSCASYIDKTAPSISITGHSGTWVTNNVTLTIKASDSLSGINSSTLVLKDGNGNILKYAESGKTEFTYEVSNDGARAFTAEVYDNAGNYNAVSANTYIDKTKPSGSISINPSGWTNGNAVISVTCSDSTSGIKSVVIKNQSGTVVKEGTGNISYTDSSEGVETYTTVITDNAGNSVSYSGTSYIDKTAPSISITGQPSGWVNTDVTLTVTVSDDASGVDSAVLKDPSGNVVATLGSGQSQFTYKVTTEGTNTYTATVYDKAGNSKSTSATVKLDKTKPTGSIGMNPSGWTNGKVVVTGTGSDSISGVASIVIRNQANAVVKTGTSTITYDDTTEGAETYTVIVTDNAGNYSSYSGVSYIDKTKPNIIITPSFDLSKWSNGNITVTVNVSDPTYSDGSCSGIKDGTGVIKNSSGTVLASLGNGKTEFSYTVTNEGINTFTVEVSDNAGNWNSASFTTKIDKTNPTGTITMSPSSWTNGNVVVTCSGADTLSGVNGMTLKNGSGVVVATGTTSITYTDTTEGTEVYTLTIVDNSGNSRDYSNTSYIDRTKPGLTVTVTPDWWTNKVVEIKGVATDDASGVKISKILDTNGTELASGVNEVIYNWSGTGIKDFVVTTTDYAGNVTSKTVTAYRDIDLPIIVYDIESGWWGDYHYVNVTLRDNTSAIASWKYQFTQSSSFPTSGWTDGTSTSGEKVLINRDGQWYLHVQATDLAGNVATKTAGTYKVDTTKPTITGYDYAIEDQKAAITVNSHDYSEQYGVYGSGVVKYGYTQSSSVTPTTWQDSSKLIIADPGVYYLYVKDLKGNISLGYECKITGYIIKYIYNYGGNLNLYKQTRVILEQDILHTEKSPKVDLYNFIAWNTNTIGSGKEIADDTDYGLTFDFVENTLGLPEYLEQGTTHTITLYGHWYRDMVLTFNLNTGTYLGRTDNIELIGRVYNNNLTYTFNITGGKTSQSKYYHDEQKGAFNCYGTLRENGLNRELTKVSTDGTVYRFLGWSVNQSSAVPDEIFNVYNNDHYKTYTISASKTLYAIWEPILIIQLQSGRTLGSINLTDVSKVVTVASDKVSGSDENAFVLTTARPGEAIKYTVQHRGVLDSFEVRVDPYISNMYDKQNPVYYDYLNIITAENATEVVASQGQTVPHSALNRFIRNPEQNLTRQFYLPQYLGTELAKEASFMQTAYYVDYTFIYNNSFYYNYINKTEKIVIRQYINLKTSDSGEVDTILNDLRTKLKIRIK